MNTVVQATTMLVAINSDKKWWHNLPRRSPMWQAVMIPKKLVVRQ